MPDKDQLAGLIADVREHVLYMQELGIDALDVHLPEPLQAVVQTGDTLTPPTRDSASDERSAPPSDLAIPNRVAAKLPEKRTPGSRIAALPSLAKRGPRIETRGETPFSAPETANSAPETRISAAENFLDTSNNLGQAGQMGHGIEGQAAIVGHGTTDTIESIRSEIGNCTRCPLHTGRTQVVHSTGNFNAELMFVGEAPGADEDEQGVPFVGRAGQLLTKIIEGIGLSRDEVFIGNINRCRPPGNRQPLPDEAAICRPYLLREIAVIKPKVIVVLGAHAAHNLLQVKTPISKLRGHFHDYFGVKVMPTFHPAYLLRDPHKKREVWEDMKKVRDLLTS